MLSCNKHRQLYSLPFVLLSHFPGPFTAKARVSGYITILELFEKIPRELRGNNWVLSDVFLEELKISSGTFSFCSAM